jgi:ParB-like chromosome segregation protein Spo0J
MTRSLISHPIAALFPDLPPADFAALKEDIRKHGVKVPILIHGGQILDGRQRYRACHELGIRCPFTEWNGHDPWLEVQSRNLLRRQLTKEQVYAIRKLAARQFPEIAAPIEAARAYARARKAQAKGKPRGQKAALIGSHDRYRESADTIGAQVGVSGSTVKRVDRLAREAPHLLAKVASGELSVRHALCDMVKKSSEPAADSKRPALFTLDGAVKRLEHMIRDECRRCPREHRIELLRSLQKQLQKLMRDDLAMSDARTGKAPFDMQDAVRASAPHIGDPPDATAHARIAEGFNSAR